MVLQAEYIKQIYAERVGFDEKQIQLSQRQLYGLIQVLQSYFEAAH